MSKLVINNDSTVTLTMEFGKEVWNLAIDKAFDKNKETVKVDGFRQGHVPRDIFNKKFGEESLYSDAIDFLLQENYGKEVEANNIMPVGYPEITIDKVSADEVVILAVIPVKPEVKLGEYKNLEVEGLDTEIKEEEVTAELNVLLDEMSEMQVKETHVEDGDTAVIDFVGYLGEEAFENGAGTDHPLVIGSGSFIPGFEEQLVGKKAGESIEVSVKFPEEYHAEDLKGQDATFKVDIKEVKTKVVPTLDDEFVKDLNRDGITNVAELKASIEEYLASSKKTQNQNHLYDQLLAKAADNAEMIVPKGMVETEIDRMINEYNQQLTMQGLSLETYFQMTGTTEETLREQMQENAKSRVEQMLVLEAIIENEKFEVTDEEVNAELTKMAEMYNMELEQITQAVGGEAAIKDSLVSRKALDFLVDNANITKQDK